MTDMTDIAEMQEAIKTVKTKYDVRIDGFEKVTGRAKYVDDLSFPGMLYAVAVHCPHAHAQVLSIDACEAMKVPGVAGVFTAEDVPGINQKEKNKPVIAGSRIRYEGEGVAVVAALTKTAAEEGAQKVKVQYEVLPAVLDPEHALDSETKLYEGGNLACEHVVRKGDIEQGFQEADLILDRTFRTQRIHHSAMEPDGAVVVPENGGITVYVGCKNPYHIQNALAEITGLPQSRVRVIQPYIGGYFGGKDTDSIVIAGRAAVVVLKTSRPCKMVWSREECMLEGSKRHPFIIHYKAGAKKDGRITAVRIEALADAGAYVTQTPGVIWRAGVEAAGPYELPNVLVDIKGVLTNHVFSDAVRGYGSPQVDFASESMMNELAEKLGLTPWEIRYKNMLTENAHSITGQEMHRVSLKECLDVLQKQFPLGESEITADGKYKARGIACLYRGESYGAASRHMKDTAGADIKVYPDGSISVYTGITEGGQGTHTAIAEVCADILGVNLNRIHVEPVDTAYVPDGGATAGSRGALSGCNAVRLAAEDLLKVFRDVINRREGDHIVILRGENEKLLDEKNQVMMSFDEAVRFCFAEGVRPEGHGQWVAPDTDWDFNRGQGKTYNGFSYGAAGAEVEIDPVTGRIDITDLICVHDIGRILNYPEAKGQIAGGVAMAVGYTQTEAVEYQKEHMTSLNYDRYLLPTAMDLPEIQAIPLSVKPAENPLGVHGVAEASTAIVAPAVANAVARAAGVHLRELPFSLETVKKALLKGEKTDV